MQRCDPTRITAATFFIECNNVLNDYTFNNNLVSIALIGSYRRELFAVSSLVPGQ